MLSYAYNRPKERPHQLLAFLGAILAERSDSKKRDKKNSQLHANVIHQFVASVRICRNTSTQNSHSGNPRLGFGRMALQSQTKMLPKPCPTAKETLTAKTTWLCFVLSFVP